MSPIPEGFERGPAPHLIIAGADEAIGFYEDVFGAQEIYRAPGPDGNIMHAMIAIGDSVVTLADADPEMGQSSPAALEGTSAGLMVYVDDADAAFEKAVEAGAEPVMPVHYMFWGDRYGQVLDPFGHRWSVATHVYDVPPEQMAELAEKAMAGETIEEPEDASPQPQPEDWSKVTTNLIVPDVGEALGFYEQALGAERQVAMPGPDGELMHSEIRVRDQIVMLGREMADMGAISPKTLGGAPVTMTIYVEDVDAAFERAVASGAQAKMPPRDMFWGDRWSVVEDPAGHLWSIATHIEDVSPEEMMERAQEAYAGAGEGAAEGGEQAAQDAPTTEAPADE